MMFGNILTGDNLTYGELFTEMRLAKTARMYVLRLVFVIASALMLGGLAGVITNSYAIGFVTSVFISIFGLVLPGFVMAPSYLLTVGFLILIDSGQYKRRVASNSAGGLLRGAQVVFGADLAQQLKSKNKVESKKGTQADIPEMDFGGIPVPFKRENTGFMVAGSPGTGKSVAIHSGMMPTMIKRGDRAFIADRSGLFVSRYYNPKNGDVILNPLDSRAVSWSPLAEIKNPWDCKTIAKSLVPDTAGEGTAGEFQKYAQTFLQSILTYCFENGLANSDIYHLAVQANIDELREKLGDTPAAAQIAEGNERMFGSIRAIVATYVDPIEYLHPHAGVNGFSIKDYVLNGKSKGRIFFNYMPDQMDMMKAMVATCMDIFALSVMSLPENPHGRRIWIIADEFASLGRVQSMENYLTNARKHGGSAILGLQNISQFFQLFGEHSAKTMLTSMASWLILRAADPDTAEFMSKAIGDKQISRTITNTSDTSSNDGGSSTTSQNQQINIERAVLPSELSALPDLVGYIRLGDLPTAKVKLRLPGHAEPVAEPYVPAEMRARNAAKPRIEAAVLDI
ncbi:MAG: type IV secretion system DNA-binding domain-containing protein [Betaproteobacteria bacterium]|nr:type IV secretion system DNA-binding domain-containing protein [Betaproteobacteria bacterium]